MVDLEPKHLIPFCLDEYLEKIRSMILQMIQLESILPEIIFFQSTLLIFPPFFLNLMCLYLNYEFSCVISKEKTYFVTILF